MDELLLERDDWMDFRTLETLSRKAGVPKDRLARLIAKELADNGMDAGGQVTYGFLDDGGFFIQDDGEGIPGSDEFVAGLFSIRRPLRSTKHLRLPTRGALGNGLRLVAGVVLATGGWLTVKTRGRSLKLTPQENGSTQVLSSEPWHGTGTRVEVYLGSRHLKLGEDLFEWVRWSVDFFGQGKEYKGSSSPLWYDSDSFWLLLQSHGTRAVRAVVEKLDGCSSRRASEVVGEQLMKRQAASLSRDEANALLERARALCKPVAPRRLGYVGRRDDFLGYAKNTGTFERAGAQIPFVVEVWANVAEEPGIVICVNRTPIVADVRVWRYSGDKTLYYFTGCNHTGFFKANRKRDFAFLVNIQCPLLPLTSDSKQPDCQPIGNELAAALENAARRASANCPAKGADRKFQQSVILDALQPAIQKVSGNGKHRYSLRQLFYAIRPVFIRAFGQEPLWGTFCKIITKHERALGVDLPGIYRDSRGTLYHPHRGQEIALGTLAVESYQRPDWTFNKILYCEKEGFFPILKDARWPERNDCALLTSKGFATRAVCDVLDLLGETDQPLTFFCIHDADGSGTMILEAMQEGAKARPARQVEIINLGLDPAEAVAMGLEPEMVKRKKRKDGRLKRVPVASYITKEWRHWLQDQRVELNAMTTPEFLAWLDLKMAPHDTGKVIPPAQVMQETLTTNIRDALKTSITQKILKEANLDAQVTAAFQRLHPVIKTRSATVSATVQQNLIERPADPWWAIVEDIAQDIAKNAIN